MHYACASGRLDNVRVLLDTPGIDKDARTNGGDTALMLAVNSGDIHTVAACLNKGCNPFCKNGLNETAMTRAEQFPSLRGQDFRVYI